MKNYLLILLILVLSLIACTESYDGKTITRQQAIEDIDFMVNYIRETHLDMFAQCSEEVFMRKVEEVKAGLPKKLGPFELFKYIGEIPPMLGDGHTNMYLGAQVELLDFDKDLIFPYTVDINAADSSFIIIENGRKVVSINNVPAKEICATLARYTSGESAAYRIGSVVQNYFPIYMKAIYPTNRYTIVYDGNGKNNSEIADAIPLSQMIEKMNVEKERALYSYSSQEDISTYILDFREFDDKEKFASLLSEMFTEIKNKNINNLIIDLRNNGGGNSQLGDELFQYISPVPFLQFGDYTARYSDNVKEAYPSLDLSINDTTIHYKADSSRLIPLRKNSLRYAGKGNIYVLASINTFSSAASFTWAFQYFDMGKIIGEETGGHIVCFGDIIGKRLPHSSLWISSSWKKFYGYGATDEHTHGVLPDYPVSAENALNFTINTLIRKIEQK